MLTPVTTLSAASYSRRPARIFYVNDSTYGAVAYSTQTLALAGTDATAAIQAAIDAAFAAGGGTVVFDPGFYRIGGALVTSRTGNAQIALPVQPYTSVKIAISLYCHEPAAAEIFPTGVNSASSAGAILVSTLTGQTYSATAPPSPGRPSVVGGPTPEANGNIDGSNVPLANLSNIYMEVHGMAVRTQANPTVANWDLGGMLAVNWLDGRAETTDVGAAITVQPTSPWAVGLLLPRANNNVLNRVTAYTCHGTYVGIAFSEHARIENVQIYECVVAVSTLGQGAGHAASLGSISVERCPYGVGYVYSRFGLDGTAAAKAGGFGSGPASAFTIDFLDVENVLSGTWSAPVQHIWDPYNAMVATVNYSFSGSGTGFTWPVKKFGGDNVRMIDRRTATRYFPPAVAATYSALGAANGTIVMPANAAALIPYSYNGVVYQIPGYLASNVAIVTHTFTGADSASSNPAADTGQAMAAITTSTWGVASNKGYCSAATGQYSVNAADSGRSDCTVQCDVTLGSTTGDAGIAFRVVDSSNYLFAELLRSGATDQILLGIRLANALSALTTVNAAGLTLGGTYTLKAVMKGCLVQVYLAGVLKVTYNIATGFEAATKHGLMCNFASDTSGSSRFDNLSITS